ncbi:MAG: DICT sensory domain-containing protein, partial [Halobacteria archaeon]|nr:DICT sensory domain-containing protein [Halobacteria archaeon]
SVNLVLANIRGEEDNVDVPESEVVESVKRSFFETRGSDKRTLIRVSREIEAWAWSDGAGELHAGFQTIERFRDNMERDVYTSLAESDLDVHIYGVGEAPSDGEFTYHTEDTEEIRDTWFVVHTGISPAALVAEERESGVYYGFWTYSSDFVEEIARYLRSEYPS